MTIDLTPPGVDRIALDMLVAAGHLKPDVLATARRLAHETLSGQATAPAMPTNDDELERQARVIDEVAKGAVIIPEQLDRIAATLRWVGEVQRTQRDLVRELDVLLNGDTGAACQASLCDLVSQLRARRTVETGVSASVGDSSDVAAWRYRNFMGEVVSDWVDGAPPEKLFDPCGKELTDITIERVYTRPAEPAAVQDFMLPGTRIEWQDNFGRWHAGTITSWKPRTYTADLDDGQQARDYAASRFRPGGAGVTTP